jgi:VWFA-related protein
MRIARLVSCCAVALILLGPVRTLSLHGQAPQAGATASQQPIFKSSTTLVEVDAIILDKQGKFVPGLAAEDMTLLEDGKPQQIQQFYMVTHSLSPTTSSAAAMAQTTADVEEHARRVFVIVFDEEHLANESLMRVKKGAEDFIHDQIGPGDVGGVFVNGAMYKGRLTNDKIELVSAVHSAKPAFDNRQKLLAVFRDFPRIPSEVDAARIADGAKELVDAIGLQACIDDPFSCSLDGGLNQVENEVQKKARLYIEQARVMTAQTVQNLQYVISNLSRIPGRKTIVFMSEGFFVEESRSTLQMVAAQAARGGTTIYSIDGRGNINSMSVNPDVTRTSQDRATTFDTGDDGPNILTSVTGGLRVRGIDDISRAFGMIANDTSTYYVIGYAPDNATLDGKFRKILVKTTTKGLEVRARQGYVATPLPPQLSLRTGNGGF